MAKTQDAATTLFNPGSFGGTAVIRTGYALTPCRAHHLGRCVGRYCASSSGRRRGLSDDHPAPRNLLAPGWASKGMGLGSRWVVSTFRALSLAALVAGGVGLASPERTPAHPASSSAVIAQAGPAAQPWDVQAIDPVGPRTAWAFLVQAAGTGPTWAEELAVTTNGGRSWADRTPPGLQPGSLRRSISQAGATGPADAWATYGPISGQPTTQSLVGDHRRGHALGGTGAAPLSRVLAGDVERGHRLLHS